MPFYSYKSRLFFCLKRLTGDFSDRAKGGHAPPFLEIRIPFLPKKKVLHKIWQNLAKSLDPPLVTPFFPVVNLGLESPTPSGAVLAR